MKLLDQLNSIRQGVKRVSSLRSLDELKQETVTLLKTIENKLQPAEIRAQKAAEKEQKRQEKAQKAAEKEKKRIEKEQREIEKQQKAAEKEKKRQEREEKRRKILETSESLINVEKDFDMAELMADLKTLAKLNDNSHYLVRILLSGPSGDEWITLTPNATPDFLAAMAAPSLIYQASKYKPDKTPTIQIIQKYERTKNKRK